MDATKKTDWKGRMWAAIVEVVDKAVDVIAMGEMGTMDDVRDAEKARLAAFQHIEALMDEL